MINKDITKVAVIGRTNVGKSTLFNRLTSSRRAIVSPIPGTTRDRNFGECVWNGKTFTIIDTGGLEDPDFKKPKTKTEEKQLLEIEQNVKKQAIRGVKQANVIVFVVDIKDGIMPQDREVAKLLRKSKKPIILAVNKISKKINESALSEFYKLGLGTAYPISATSGAGTGDLLDEITKKIPKTKPKTIPPTPLSSPLIKEERKGGWENAGGVKTTNQLSISIIGRPNVGKSSLLNIFAGEERAIVSARPHTTREAQEIIIEHKDKQIKLIDTAGVRRKAKINNSLERLGVRQSLNIFEKSDIIIFIIDASESISKQDQSLARLVQESGKPVIIIANKWDLVKEIEMSDYEKYFRKYFPHISFAPIIFASCKSKRNIDKVMDMAIEIQNESRIEIIPNALSKFLAKIMKDLKKFQGKSKSTPRLLDFKQTNVQPPAFEIIMKKSKLKKPHPSIVKYVENQLRKKFNLKRVPVKITLRTIKIKQ